MAKLPKLYTLDTVPVAGHIEHAVPPSLNCFECGSPIAPYYQEFEFVFDSLRECDLVVSSDSDVYLVSRQLLAELDAIGAKGYTYRSVRTSIGDNLRRTHEGKTIIADFQYFVITGRCDGPWVHHTKGKACTACGQMQAEPKDFATWMSEVAGDVPRQPRLVYPETWHGEDFFFLSEPGPPLITERVATILAKTGNLRRKEVTNKDRIRHLMPKQAAKLEKKNWQIEVCISLGPADWVATS